VAAVGQNKLRLQARVQITLVRHAREQNQRRVLGKRPIHQRRLLLMQLKILQQSHHLTVAQQTQSGNLHPRRPVRFRLRGRERKTRDRQPHEREAHQQAPAQL
jgi:hypothetical protein